MSITQIVKPMGKAALPLMGVISGAMVAWALATAASAFTLERRIDALEIDKAVSKRADEEYLRRLGIIEADQKEILRLVREKEKN